MKKPAAIAALSALAQDTRLDAYRLLVQAGPDGLPAGENQRSLGEIASIISASERRAMAAERETGDRLIALFLADRIGELRSFDDVKLLSVMVNRLRQWWRPGLICIGDAAHAMSPIGGVGINIAVQDAVAAANRLAAPLRAGTTASSHLQAIQARRDFPARMTQKIQLTMQNQIIGPALQGTRDPKPPLLFRLFDAAPRLRRLPGRLLALGIRPEHVQTPDIGAAG